ncbi:hypothetical protein [Horticoccus sp. 23ND18S-11]|uniref:hypothetical protein n=1 Tax=Horticoccus sp. 23ND18S-11 TaxID=3391832 RepID=UPI0039C9E4E5
MSLNPDQKKAVVSWVAAGDNLSAVQKKLMEQFQISLTYRDVRFLVDDLDLQLKDAAPKVDTSDVSKTPPPPEAPAPRQAAAGKKGPADLAGADEGDADLPADEGLAPEGEEAFDDLPPEGGASNVAVAVDKLTLIPGAMASGTVTFSDGVTAKWIVDQYGRPGFTEVSKPGYRPTPADGQAFMQELSSALQKRGF